MPLQNKVDPFGAIHAVSMRGDLMGNRGCLHNEHKQLVRQRSSYRAWVACLLQFKGVQRELMAPRQYTELFFLDEATALAAGHRPCFYCRRADAKWFAQAWHQGHGFPAETLVRVKDMDDALHRDRLLPDEARIVPLSQLPYGSIFSTLDRPEIALLTQLRACLNGPSMDIERRICARGTKW